MVGVLSERERERERESGFHIELTENFPALLLSIANLAGKSMAVQAARGWQNGKRLASKRRPPKTMFTGINWPMHPFFLGFYGPAIRERETEIQLPNRTKSYFLWKCFKRFGMLEMLQSNSKDFNTKGRLLVDEMLPTEE